MDKITSCASLCDLLKTHYHFHSIPAWSAQCESNQCCKRQRQAKELFKVQETKDTWHPNVMHDNTLDPRPGRNCHRGYFGDNWQNLKLDCIFRYYIRTKSPEFDGTWLHERIQLILGNSEWII